MPSVQRARELFSSLRVRLVFFVNEEPPFFKTDRMGSLVYARRLSASGERAIVYMGRITKRKGLETLMEALENDEVAVAISGYARLGLFVLQMKIAAGLRAVL